MGYRLSGKALQTRENNQLVSSGVSFGTIQLLPSGQLIVLMADHQTTGGYPRIATITSTHWPRLAQSNPDDAISFSIVGIEKAEGELMKQAEYLQSVQTAAQYKIEKWLA
jgi:antagonist of KipI